jgi:ribonuclease III
MKIDTMETKNNTELEIKLRYKFGDQSLLDNALRHSSYVNEQNDDRLRDNERLEFLGDAVLNLIVGHILMDFFPDLHEGDLSRMRASLVNESQLAEIAGTLKLGNFILLGKGELQSNGRRKKSILSDAFEAVIAALYLDGGFEKTFEIIEPYFVPLLKNLTEPARFHDSKSQLQELVQMKFKSMPQYRVIHEMGPDHDKTFRVRMKVNHIETEGIGKSKKAAEQDAARKGLRVLNENEN